MQTQLLGDTMLTLPNLSSRIGQSEINIANILTELNSLKDTGVDANLFFVEDFSNDCRFCDFFKTKVNTVAAGGKYIVVESLDGILAGHTYTISDGTRSERKRVAYTTREESQNNVFFETDVTKKYTKGKTYLYRSTSIAENGKLGGVGDLKVTTVALSGQAWKGSSASAEVVKEAETTTSNEKGFKPSGNYAFTADGQFTLDLGGD